MIAIYDQLELVEHPVIQKAIAVKWRLYGKRDTWTKVTWTTLHTILWLILAYDFPDNHEHYTPLSKNAWKIVIEIVIILSWVYFVSEVKYCSINMCIKGKPIFTKLKFIRHLDDTPVDNEFIRAVY